jgi:hypothetical protein
VFFHRFFTSSASQEKRDKKRKEKLRRHANAESANVDEFDVNRKSDDNMSLADTENISESEINKILEAELDDNFFDDDDVAAELGVSTDRVSSDSSLGHRSDGSMNADNPSKSDSEIEHSYSDLSDEDFDDDDAGFSGSNLMESVGKISIYFSVCFMYE